MKLIANETAYARKCLEQNYIDRQKPNRSIRAVARYLNQVCHINNIEDIYCSVLSYVESTGKDVEIEQDRVLSMINDNSPMNDIGNIIISQKELDTINSFGYPYSYRIILFTMLVHYKVKLALYPEHNNHRIESKITEIMKDAHVTLPVKKRDEMIGMFEKDGLLTQPNGGTQAKYFYLHFIDDEQQEVGVVVEDFFDFYLYYEQYEKGGRLIYCQECGKLVLDNSKTQPKTLCSKCKKDRHNESTKEYMRKKRSN